MVCFCFAVRAGMAASLTKERRTVALAGDVGFQLGARPAPL